LSDERIPFVDLEAENGPLREALRAAIERVMDTNRFILGPVVSAFEAEVAAHLGVPHAVGVSSGTDALLAALMAVGVGPGDEVVTTPYSFFATAGCVARLGAKPVFVDIEPGTFNIDPERVTDAITSRTRAILPVHPFGQPDDGGALRDAVGGRDVPVIEDAAQAIGGTTDAGPVGVLGDLGCFSFFPSKNLGCFGDGGMITTGDEELTERIRVLRVHGAKPKYFHAVVGGNFRLDAIQAAVLRVKLPHLDEWMEARRRNAQGYDAFFADAGLDADLLRPPRRAAEGHVYNQYVIRTSRRDGLRAHLAEAAIDTAIYYPRPLHLQECFAYLGHREGDFPEAERASVESLALPIFPTLGEARLARVAETVVSYLRSRGRDLRP